MKNLLFTLALLVSFNSFGQTISLQDIKNGGMKEGIVRKYLDQFDNLKNIEGIFNYSNNNPSIKSSYKLLILFDENDYVYKGLIMEARCVGCQHWRLGETKLILEESALEGEFNFKWYQPGRRNKKGVRKSPNTYISGEAYEEYDGVQITFEFSDMSEARLMRKYPK